MATPANVRPADDLWPSLPLAEWQDTRDTLHMWLQIVGKTRLALSPKQNHWWHVPLYVTARGLTTSPIPYGLRTFEVELDFIDHRLIVRTSDGAIRETALRPQAVADFYKEYMGTLASLGIVVKMRPVPTEIENPIPFLEDRRHAAYDAEQVNRFFRVLAQADRITKRFQGRFLGKTSPVHFFWGGDQHGVLAGKRFRGRACVLRVHASGASRSRFDLDPSGRSLLQPRAGRLHPPVRGGPVGFLARRRGPGFLSERLRGGG